MVQGPQEQGGAEAAIKRSRRTMASGRIILLPPYNRSNTDPISGLNSLWYVRVACESVIPAR